MRILKFTLAAALASATACAHSTVETAPVAISRAAPSPDPRVGLKAGLWDAGQAAWNLRVVSTTPPPEAFKGQTNSDLAFLGKYAIQGNYNGWQIWDISNPAHPTIETAYVCPASQSDVSVYKNLLFISGEGLGGRVDCGTQGVQDTVSSARLRGLRIFDISDIKNPRNVGNVQTCRGSHTHSVLVDPKDPDNVYVYISGSYIVRSPNELPGCVSAADAPNTSLFRIEVIKVPVNNPAAAAIVNSPRIFENLMAVQSHGPTTQDTLGMGARIAAAKARGAFTYRVFGNEQILNDHATMQFLDSIVKQRGGTGAPTAADSAQLRRDLQPLVDKLVGAGGPRRGPTQCHDITLYPAIGLGGGACEGYGFLLDISNPTNPIRIDQVADSNFSYWHSATFNNAGTQVLFSDEWGGGGQPKCRATDPKQWGADAMFSIDANRRMHFENYYKLPAPQTVNENCVAHNGSLIPIPGRDVMVQAWYQGGISVFDWTDPINVREIAFFDRGPVDSTRMAMGGFWSAYWYNGVIVGSEIARGLDIFELTPSAFLTQNEIDAAKSVHLDYLNTQGQPRIVWPATFALARAYADQLERSHGVSASRLAAIRASLASAEGNGAGRAGALAQLASQLDADAASSSDAAKVRMLSQVVKDLAK